MNYTLPIREVNNDTLWICDMISQDRLTDIIHKKKYILLDSFREFDNSNLYYAYFWLGNEIKQFVNLEYTDTITTDHAVNFIINKKQINRYLTIKLVELYNLRVGYSWSGIGETFDLGPFLDDIHRLPIDRESASSLLSPIKLKKNWIDIPGKEILNNLSSIADYNGNLWSWLNGLDKIISRSAVSLITESIQEQKFAAFTEKTVYSVLGLTFPIWIGGYKQAEEWSRIGFDIFSDIINHDYQHYDTLVERCWHAIYDNLKLLQDYQQLTKLREQQLPRLKKNRDLILANTVSNYNIQLMSCWPPDLEQSVNRSIIKKLM